MVLTMSFVRRMAQRAAMHPPAQMAMPMARAPVRRCLGPRSALLSERSARATTAFSTLTQPAIAIPRVAADAHESSLTGIIAAAAAVTAVMGLGKMWWDASAETPRGPRDAHPAASTRAITREELTQFFVDLKLSLSELFKQLPEIDAKFREHVKAQKLELSADEYKQELLQQVFGVVQSIEQQIVGQRGWSQESFAHAMEKFKDDPEVQQLGKELQTIMQSVFPTPEIPEHVTPDVVLEILTSLVQGMETAMKSMLDHARAEGITDPNKAMEEFQQIYLDQVQQVTFKEMEKHNIQSDIFNFALQKFHSENAEFKKKVEEIYSRQAAAFRRMGLAVQTE